MQWKGFDDIEYIDRNYNYRPDVVPKVIIDDFLNGYYGKAGKYMGEWLDLLHEEVKKRPQIHCTCGPEADMMRDFNLGVEDIIWPTMYCPTMTYQVVARSKRLLGEVENLADSLEILNRVRCVKLSVEYVEVMRDTQIAAIVSDASGSFAMKSAFAR